MYKHLAGAAAALLIGAGAASAATTVFPGAMDGDSFSVDAGETVIVTGSVEGIGGPGDFEIVFDVDPIGGTGVGAVALTFANFIGYDGLLLEWIDDDGADAGTVLSSTVVDEPVNPVPGSGGTFTVDTSFSAGALAQILRLSWTDSTVNPVTGTAGTLAFSAQVSAVPVPAAGLLLLGALGGMAGLRRRRKAVEA